jgi:hypothetical protein
MEPAAQPEPRVEDLLEALPCAGMRLTSGDDVISILPNGTMMLAHEKAMEIAPEAEAEVEAEPMCASLVREETDGFADTETEADPAELTLTDFLETTDSEAVDWRVLLKLDEMKRGSYLLPRGGSGQGKQ